MTTHVLAVAPSDLDDVWPHIKHYISAGLKVSGDDPRDVARDVLAKNAHLWVVADDHPTKFRAAFLTAAKNINGRHVVVIYGLAGNGAREWASAIEARMIAYCREVGALAFQFAGKPGWQGLLPQCKEIGRVHDAAIYERAA